MYKTKRKYGFLTTYNETIFFKQEKHPTKKRWILWHSPVIGHDTPSSVVGGPGTQRKELSNPALYRTKVSLRECFLYFQELAWRDTCAENGMKPDVWTSPSKSKIDQYDYISDDAPSSSEEDNKKQPAQGPSTSVGQSSTRRGGTTSDSVADIERRARRLALDDRPRPHAQLPWRPGDFLVHFSETSRRWYYEYKGKPVYVELYEEEHEHSPSVRYFIINGYRHRAREAKGKQRKR